VAKHRFILVYIVAMFEDVRHPHPCLMQYLLIMILLVLLQLHLDHTIGAYFDYGNHTEKVSAALSLSCLSVRHSQS
jgi:hypothetical protein